MGGNDSEPIGVAKPGDVTRLLPVKHADAPDVADKVTRSDYIPPARRFKKRFVPNAAVLI